MTIYKNIKAGHIVYFNSSSDDRQLSLQFPSDVEELFPQMTSIPAVVVHYISVGNALNAFNPSLPK